MSDLEDEASSSRGPDRKRVRFGAEQHRAVSPGRGDEEDQDEEVDDPLARKGRKRRLPVADSEDMPQDDAFLQEVGRALRDDDEDDGGDDGPKKAEDSEDEGSDEGGEASGARSDRDKRISDKESRRAEDKLQQQKIRLDESVKGETSLSRDANAGAQIEKFDMGGYWDEDGRFVDEEDEEGQEADEFVRGLVQQKSVTEDLAKPRQAKPKAPQRKLPALPDDPIALKRILLSRMEPGENVLKSLARLKPKVAKAAKKHGYGKKDKDRQAAVVVGSLDTAEARAAARDARMAEAEKKLTEDDRERQSDFDMITEAAQALLAAGDYDIYQATYENLQQALAAQRGAAGRGRPPSGPPSRGPAPSTHAPASSSSGAAGVDMFSASARPPGGPSPTSTWEYKWNDAQTHGPFSGEQMMAWRDQGYFDKAMVRRVEPYPSDWVQGSRTTNFLS